MRARTLQPGTLKGFSSSVIVEPFLAGFEAVDDRVARGGIVLRSVLVRGTVAAADVAAFGAAAQM